MDNFEVFEGTTCTRIDVWHTDGRHDRVVYVHASEYRPAEDMQHAAQSGYTSCACRDCMDVTVSSDMAQPELCSECKDAGCVAIAPYNEGIQFCTSYECQRDDAYEEA